VEIGDSTCLPLLPEEAIAAFVVLVFWASLSSDDLSDICWANLRAKIVFVPCGHAGFCDSCAHQNLQLRKNSRCVRKVI